MYSIKFPDMFSGVTTFLVEDKEATAQNLKLVLLSDRDSLFGDPYFGTIWRKLIFEQNNEILRDIIIDDILTTIQTFVPQLLTKREDITVTSDRYSVSINIKALNLLDYQTDMYSIKLMEDELE